MNIAQSINFPIPSSTAGSQAIKSPHSGNISTDILSSHPQFFYFQISYVVQVVGCHSVKLIFICKLTYKLDFLRQMVEVFFPSMVPILYGVS